MVAPSDQERLPRWKYHPTEEWACIAVVPNASTSSLAHALALSLHTRMCVYWCHSSLRRSDWLPHCCSFPELGPMTQTDLSASLWLHINMTQRTNSRNVRIGDLTRYRISWGSPLMVPLRVHMLSIDNQNYQIQKIMVINKTGHPAYWTRHKETLNCQFT